MAMPDPFTHDLVVLFKRLLRSGVDVEPHRDLARFTDFAVQFRGAISLRRRSRADGARSSPLASAR
jgi:hypothetical protein